MPGAGRGYWKVIDKDKFSEVVEASAAGYVPGREPKSKRSEPEVELTLDDLKFVLDWFVEDYAKEKEHNRDLMRMLNNFARKVSEAAVMPLRTILDRD